MQVVRTSIHERRNVATKESSNCRVSAFQFETGAISAPTENGYGLDTISSSRTLSDCHHIDCPIGRDGEIGRRSGLKIRRPERVVGVQVPLPAPSNRIRARSSPWIPLIQKEWMSAAPGRFLLIGTSSISAPGTLRAFRHRDVPGRGSGGRARGRSFR